MLISKKKRKTKKDVKNHFSEEVLRESSCVVLANKINGRSKRRKEGSKDTKKKNVTDTYLVKKICSIDG